MDIVFDVYRPSNLKAETRTKRGKGARRRVTENGKLPNNWRSFIRDDINKTELFEYLAEKVATVLTEKTVIITKGAEAISNHHINLHGITPCSHEEADTRIML